MSLKKVFKLVAINLIAYDLKQGENAGKKQYRKECKLKRYERSAFSGKMVPATMNADATVSFFPQRFNRQGEVVDNEIYKNLSEYLEEQMFVTTKRFTTSPFNFASDAEDAEPREQLTVTVTYEESDTDATIQNRLVKQAEYQLRGTQVAGGHSVDIVEDGVRVGVSASETEWSARREEAQAKADSLRGNGGNTDNNSNPEPLTFDAQKVEDAFVAANPEATEDEIIAHLEAEEAAFNENAVQGAE